MLRFAVFLILLGVVIYFSVRLLEGKGLPNGLRRNKRAPGRPISPDDDPDFLRGL